MLLHYFSWCTGRYISAQLQHYTELPTAEWFLHTNQKPKHRNESSMSSLPYLEFSWDQICPSQVYILISHNPFFPPHLWPTFSVDGGGREWGKEGMCWEGKYQACLWQINTVNSNHIQPFITGVYVSGSPSTTPSHSFDMQAETIISSLKMKHWRAMLWAK